MSVSRLPGRPCDSLFLSFSEARISVLEWDTSSHDVKVDALHYYENDEKLRDGRATLVTRPKLVISERRCAAMVAYDQHLIVIPLQRLSLPMEPDTKYSEEELHKRFPPSYTMSLESMGIKHVRDLIFLEGFYAPTLLVLHEPSRTAFNRTSEKTMTVKATAIALDLNNRKHAVVWSRDNLPYNTEIAVSVPKPLGGSVILSPNAAIYINANAYVVLTLNHFGDSLTYSGARTRKSRSVVVLDSPRCSWVSLKDLFLSTKSGQAFVLHLESESSSVSSLKLSRVGDTVSPTAVCTLKSLPDSEDLSGAVFFIGSRVDDSVLVRLVAKTPEELESEKIEAEKVKAETIASIMPEAQDLKTEENLEPPAKIAKTEPLPPAMDDDELAMLNNVMQNAMEMGFQGEGEEEYEDGYYEDEMEVETPLPPPVALKKPEVKHVVEAEPEPVKSVWQGIEGDEMTQEDRDLLEFFKARENLGAQSEQKFLYKLVELDRLLGAGPVADFVVMPSMDEASLSKIDAADKKEFQKQSRKLVEMVSAIGSEKSGALLVLQQSLRPQINVNFSVPELEAMWSLKHKASPFHKLLVLSRSDSTLVLESGESLQEITNTTEFVTNQPTITAGSILRDSFFVQVYPNGALLMDGSQKIFEWTTPEKGVDVIAAQILDPFVIVQLSNFSLVLLEAKLQQGETRLTVCSVSLNDSDATVSTFSAFKDASRRSLFNFAKGHETISHKRRHSAVGLDNSLGVDGVERVEDPEERELYRGSDTAVTDDDDLNEEILSESEIQRPYYVALALDSGALQIVRFTSNSSRVVFSCSSFTNLPMVIANDLEKASEARPSVEGLFPSIVDLHVASFDSLQAPQLFALSDDGSIAVYECFASPASAHQTLPVRFRRLEAPIFRNMKGNVRDFQQMRDPDEHFSVVSSSFISDSQDGIRRTRFHSFSNVRDGLSGVFIAGEAPTVAINAREALRFFPVTTEGHINAFAEFNNTSNIDGFIFHSKTEAKVKIAQLPKDFRFELPLVSKRINIGRTIHSIAFDAPTSLLLVMTSYKVINESHYYQVDLANNASSEEPKPENTITDIPLPDRLPDLPEERFELYLINPEDWVILDKMLLSEEEYAMSMRVVHMKVKQGDKFVFEPLIAIGSMFVRGEDQPVLGNIRIVDVLRPQDVTAARLNNVVTVEQRGPVSSVGHVEGVLVACIGMKILLFSFFNRTELVGCGFFDCQIQIVNTVTLKNYILLADVYKSIYFLRWREDSQQLDLLGKDYDARSIFSTDFFVDGENLSFLVSDVEKNLMLYKFDPNDPESRAGQKLLCVGDYHLGANVNRFVRMKMNVLKSNRQLPIPRYCNVFGTTDGAVGAICPVDEATFEKFGKLEMRMVSALAHTGGLNPKAFRLSKSWQSMTQNRIRSVIDSSLLKRFVLLDRQSQTKLASIVGLTPTQIFDFLMDINLRASLF